MNAVISAARMIPITARAPKNDLVEVEAKLNGISPSCNPLKLRFTTMWADLERMMPVSGCTMTARKERYIGICELMLIGVGGEVGNCRLGVL